MSLARSCQLLGISRQAVYQRLQRAHRRQSALAPVKDLVLEVRSKLPRIGTRKLYYLLKDRFAQQSIKLGRDGLFTYLREQQLLIRPTKRYTQTTHSKHWLHKHPNLFAAMSIDRPEQAFVSDITYVESREGVHYLSLVTDAYSRKIMGHALSLDMKAKHMDRALRIALQNRQTLKPLVHHSDRGMQYCSARYQKTLEAHNIKPSMTDGYDCYQNALAERVNGILKAEFLLTRCNTFEELDKVVRQSIDLYNHFRPHLSLGMKTPEQVHKEKAGCL